MIALLMAVEGPIALARPVPADWQPKPMKRPSVGTNAAMLDGRWHRIHITPPPNLPKIHAWQKFNPVWWLENADDPIPPDWYRPDQKGRETKWRFRNPFHNLTFYVIGVADKQTVRSGRFPDEIANPNSGWNVAVSRRRIVLLPFVSYQRGRFEFYFGWHPRGNFGIKFNFSDSNLPHDSKPAVHSVSPSPIKKLPVTLNATGS